MSQLGSLLSHLGNVSESLLSFLRSSSVALIVGGVLGRMLHRFRTSHACVFRLSEGLRARIYACRVTIRNVGRHGILLSRSSVSCTS